MSLSKKTALWVKQELITEEQRQNILSFENKKGNHTFWNTAFIIAGCLIGFGICLLIAANWDELSSAVKLTGDFILLGAFITATYISIQKQKNGLKELFAVLSFLLIGGTIGLTSQIFNLSGGWNNFVITWAVLGLPFILLSRSSFLNMFWLCILLSLNEGKLIRELLTYISDKFNYITFLCVLGLYLLHIAFAKLDEIQGKYIVLPKSASKLFLWITYFSVFCIGSTWGLYHGWIVESKTLYALGAYIIVFGFFGFRMYWAVKEQNIKSFKRNAILSEIYIFLIFAFKMNDLWLSGIGFICGGLLILFFIWVLRRTTRYIKTMEVFK